MEAARSASYRDPAVERAQRRSFRRAIRRLLGDLRGDPAHAPVIFAIEAVNILGRQTAAELEEVRARRPDADPGELSAEAVADGVRLAAVEGGIAGTPLYIALVPAYVSLLLAQARVVLRVAALHGRRPDDRDAVADLLMLRGVHTSPDEARRAVDERLAGGGGGERPHGLHGWYELGKAMLILAGFVEPKELQTQRGRLKGGLLAILAGLIWALTWVVPVTFILVMAWSGQTSTERLGERALRHYGEAAAASAYASARRAGLRSLVVLASAALPAVLLFVTARWAPAGVRVGHVLAALAALALALALFARAGRFGAAD
jgi:hypothetical protein